MGSVVPVPAVPAGAGAGDTAPEGTGPTGRFASVSPTEAISKAGLSKKGRLTAAFLIASVGLTGFEPATP